MRSGVEYVESVALPPPPEDEDVPFPVPKEQVASALVVGSSVITLGDSLTADERSGVMNATLLAQLAANKRADGEATTSWYQAYFETLQRIGFSAIDTQFADYEAHGRNVAAHEIVLELAIASLGETSAAVIALKRVIAVLSAHANRTDSPWLTLFNRESCRKRDARFQIVSVDKTGGAIVVALASYALTVTGETSQVLFVRVGENDAQLSVRSGRLAVADEIYNRELRRALAKRVASYAADFIANVPL